MRGTEPNHSTAGKRGPGGEVGCCFLVQMISTCLRYAQRKGWGSAPWGFGAVVRGRGDVTWYEPFLHLK
jgi:hypothetical protein